MNADAVAGSPIHAIMERVSALRGRGENVLGLHLGEPEFPTPPGIQEAAIRAIREGFTRYAPSPGLPDLRAVLADRLTRGAGVPIDADHVVVMPAKFAVFAALLATVGPGDEVVLPDPTYLLEGPVRLVGAKPVYVAPGPDHAIDLEAIDAAVTPRSRALVLVSPSNPTGRILRRDEWRALASIARDRHLTLLSDETYASLVYDGRHVPAASANDPGVPLVTVGSFSKTYAMTGWRAGFAVATGDLRDRLVSIVEQTLTCVPPFVQKACLWALEHAEADAARFREMLRERRDHVLARLDDLPGVAYPRPEGAFYVFPSYPLHLDAERFAAQLLEEERVAVVPGSAFGPHGEGHVRLSFASPLEVLEEALTRLAAFLERHGARRG